MAFADDAHASWQHDHLNEEVPERPKEVTGRWPHSLSHEPLLRVSDVLAAVQPEFPTLTPSKLRFLDTQGLVCPERTSGGYRHYSPADVERLRFVLRQQRDHFRPLTVILENLVDLDNGAAHEQVVPTAVGEGGALWLQNDEIAARAGVGLDVVSLLEAEGLVKEGLPGRFHRDDIDVVEAAARYLSAGGDIRALRSVRNAAIQEAERIHASVAPLRAKGAGEEASDDARNRGEVAASLYSAVIRRQVTRD